MDINNRFLYLQQMKYNLFKSQNPENGRFDVVFEIEGKLLYAHKTMLNLVSDTFDSMLSERWTPNKNEPIKIKDYSFDDFYQFLTFLYSGHCQLNGTNIFSMVDIAEFYGVQLFKNYCEEYFTNIEITTENIFLLMDLADKYSMVQLNTLLYDLIIKNFNDFVLSNGFLKVKKHVFKEIIVAVKDEIEPKDLFIATYIWSENQAIEKFTAESNLNLNETIKAEFADFFPYINFHGMGLTFLHKFVVPKSFIFPSLEEFSKILCDCHLQTEVKVINLHGQELHGNILPDKNMINVLKSLNSKFCLYITGKNYCWWNTHLSSIPSSIKKKEGIEWYLVYSRFGHISVQHCSNLSQNVYLIAEMIPGYSGFQMTKDCRIQME